MTAAVWSYMVTDFRTGAIVRDHLPIRCDSFSDGLGLDSYTLTGSLDLAKDHDPEDALLPWRRVIWPMRQGIPFGAYVLTKRPTFGPSSTAIDFVSERFDVVFNRREIESTLVFSRADQFVIFRALMRYAMGRTPIGVDGFYLAMVQQLPAADIPWLRFEDNLSGILRDRLDNDDGYQRARHPKIGSMLTDLLELEQGFEYRPAYFRDPQTGRPYVTPQTGYPQLGRTTPVLSLEHPGALKDWGIADDTADTENYSRAYGPGQGAEKVLVTGAPAIDYQALNEEGWPLLMGSESSTASDQAALDAAGRARQAAFAGVNEGVMVKGGKGVLGTYDLGDAVNLRLTSRRWPGGKRVTARAIGHTVEPTRSGREEQTTLSVVAA